MSVILIILLFLLSIILTAMTAAYATLSTPHLRHWARKNDPAARKLYPLKARGSASYLTIELLRAFTLSAAFILLSTALTPLWAWFIAAVLFFVAFVVLTQLYLKPFGIRLLVLLSRPLLALTHLLKPVTLPLGRVLDSFLEEEPVTLTRNQLSGMLDAVAPEDTDLSLSEIRILSKVLDFAQKKVYDVMIPKSKAVTISISDTLSPVVLNELHKSGHERFPVLGEDGKSVVGILSMHDLMDIKHHSAVEEIMMQKVYFVEEDRDLNHVLQIFYKTKQSVFVVIDTASKMVGIISIEDIVQQLLGKPHATTKHQPPHPVTGEEPIQVVK